MKLLWDWGTFLILAIAVAIPLGIGLVIGYYFGRKDERKLKTKPNE